MTHTEGIIFIKDVLRLNDDEIVSYLRQATILKDDEQLLQLVCLTIGTDKFFSLLITLIDLQTEVLAFQSRGERELNKIMKETIEASEKANHWKKLYEREQKASAGNASAKARSDNMKWGKRLLIKYSGTLKERRRQIELSETDYPEASDSTWRRWFSKIDK